MRAPGRVFALSQPGVVTEGEGSNAVVEGTFLVYTSWARVLFDFGSTHSFISASFTCALGLETKPLGYSLSMETAFSSRGTNLVCRACSLHIYDLEFEVDLIVL